MIVVGLTGGIGSGKSTVAKIFEEFKIPIYVADDEAKLLMNTSEVIRSKLIRLFGENAYLEGKLNRKYLASSPTTAVISSESVSRSAPTSGDV